MWESDTKENTNLPDEYKKIVKKAKKQTDNNIYIDTDFSCICFINILNYSKKR